MSEKAVDLSRSEVILPRTLIARAANQFRNRVAVRTFERDWSFAEIDDRSTRLANALSNAGIEPDARVAVLRWNEVEHFEISLALLKLGAAMVNVNPRLSPPEISWQITDSGCEAMLASAGFSEILAELGDELSALALVAVFGGEPGPHTPYEELLTAAPATAIETPIGPESLAYIRYTSGTTGRPKGVVHDQTTIAAVTRNLLLDYVPDMTSADVMLALQGLYHGAGWFALPCWIRGVPMVVAPKLDPESAVEAIKRFDVTFVKTVPTILTRLLDHLERTGERIPSVKSVIYGASPMPAAVLQRGIDLLGPVFVQLYGQAESPMTITVLRKEEHLGRVGATGRPITLADVRVVDEDGRDTKPGEIGEVIVRGDHNMRGYWNRSYEDWQDVVRDGWVHTRDMARIDEEGFLYLVDRKNDVIITGGLNVFPNEVEQTLYQHPDVLEVAVVGVADREWGEIITAVVVAKAGRKIDEAALCEVTRETLSSFKRPRQLVVVDALPKNAAGKIVRREVRDVLWPQVAERAYAADWSVR